MQKTQHRSDKRETRLLSERKNRDLKWRSDQTVVHCNRTGSWKRGVRAEKAGRVCAGEWEFARNAPSPHLPSVTPSSYSSYSSISNPRFLTLEICFNGSSTHSHKSRRNSVWFLEVTGLIRPWELTWCCLVGEMDSASVISNQTIMWSYGWANYKKNSNKDFFSIGYLKTLNSIFVVSFSLSFGYCCHECLSGAHSFCGAGTSGHLCRHHWLHCSPGCTSLSAVLVQHTRLKYTAFHTLLYRNGSPKQKNGWDQADCMWVRTEIKTHGLLLMRQYIFSTMLSWSCQQRLNYTHLFLVIPKALPTKDNYLTTTFSSKHGLYNPSW